MQSWRSQEIGSFMGAVSECRALLLTRVLGGDHLDYIPNGEADEHEGGAQHEQEGQPVDPRLRRGQQEHAHDCTRAGGRTSLRVGRWTQAIFLPLVRGAEWGSCW